MYFQFISATFFMIGCLVAGFLGGSLCGFLVDLVSFAAVSDLGFRNGEEEKSIINLCY